MNKNIIRCLIWGTLFLLINIIGIIFDFSILKILIFNSFFVIAIIDYYKFFVPDSVLLLILISLIINKYFLNIFNIIISSLVFLICFYYWKNKKMGFGDVKLLTIMALYLNYHVFYVIIISIFTILIVNLFKKSEVIPFAFYLFLGFFIYSIILEVFFVI